MGLPDTDERHRCEVRHWMRLRAEKGKAWLRKTLIDIEERRGRTAADRLRSDISEQWEKGNRGERGDWR